MDEGGSSALIEASDLAVAPARGQVIGPVSFEVAPGEAMALLGPNGAGKSTLMRALLGLIPYRGTARMAGASVVPGRPPDATRGMVDRPAFFEAASVRTNLEVVAVDGRLLEADFALLERAALLDLLDRRPGRLSMGQRQRLAICRTLIGEPSCLVLDEATNGLDPAGARWFRDELGHVRDRGAAVLFSTHILTEAAAMCDAAVVIEGGRIVGRTSSGAELTERPEVLEHFYLQALGVLR